MRRLSCRAEGWPEPELAWYRDGEPLQEVGSSSLLEVGGSRSLLLRQVTARDSAIYSCLAHNLVGSAAIEYHLQVYFLGEMLRGGEDEKSEGWAEWMTSVDAEGL